MHGRVALRTFSPLSSPCNNLDARSDAAHVSLKVSVLMQKKYLMGEAHFLFILADSSLGFLFCPEAEASQAKTGANRAIYIYTD